VTRTAGHSKSSWQNQAGKIKLAKSSWQDQDGKIKMARSRWLQSLQGGVVNENQTIG
jgi:hypothetical protein